jgi:serine/threonine protein kinase
MFERRQRPFEEVEQERPWRVPERQDAPEEEKGSHRQMGEARIIALRHAAVKRPLPESSYNLTRTMTLTPGMRLGPYQVTEQIGEGGMGEVYRATDTTLARSVAIKVLPEAVASDAERLARFEREAKTLASLNHPNIAQVYGFEKSDGVRAIVMELVEGPTLADRIAAGPIPIDEALQIASQIAEALEAAHDHGIIHRDLKPANVKVRSDGTVKVLDFGLAKGLDAVAAVSGASLSPTITSPAMTHAGIILGTAAYMSPEQARGKPVDRRADIWAFGCVLFEMLAGRRPFPEEETVSDTIAGVLRAEPAWNALDGVPPHDTGARPTVPPQGCPSSPVAYCRSADRHRRSRHGGRPTIRRCAVPPTVSLAGRGRCRGCHRGRARRASPAGTTREDGHRDAVRYLRASQCASDA